MPGPLSRWREEQGQNQRSGSLFKVLSGKVNVNDQLTRSLTSSINLNLLEFHLFLIGIRHYDITFHLKWVVCYEGNHQYNSYITQLGLCLNLVNEHHFYYDLVMGWEKYQNISILHIVRCEWSSLDSSISAVWCLPHHLPVYLDSGNSPAGRGGHLLIFQHF